MLQQSKFTALSIPLFLATSAQVFCESLAVTLALSLNTHAGVIADLSSTVAATSQDHKNIPNNIKHRSVFLTPALKPHHKNLKKPKNNLFFNTLKKLARPLLTQHRH
jgi:hypothetical protein